MSDVKKLADEWLDNNVPIPDKWYEASVMSNLLAALSDAERERDELEEHEDMVIERWNAQVSTLKQERDEYKAALEQIDLLPPPKEGEWYGVAIKCMKIARKALKGGGA